MKFLSDKGWEISENVPDYNTLVPFFHFKKGKFKISLSSQLIQNLSSHGSFGEKEILSIPFNSILAAKTLLLGRMEAPPHIKLFCKNAFLFIIYMF